MKASKVFLYVEYLDGYWKEYSMVDFELDAYFLIIKGDSGRIVIPMETLRFFVVFDSLELYEDGVKEFICPAP